MITTTDPATGACADTGLAETTEEQVDALVGAAQGAAITQGSWGREKRAQMLEAMAQSIEAAREQLVATARTETALSEQRLSGELSRAAFQFRLFAEAVREGSYLEAIIDHAAETALGPAPDLRRMLVPLGPVAVFGASNFPFAFSVLGGDTASALAAGCPVVIKAHESHPLTCALSLEVLQAGLSDCGAPTGIVSLVYGREAARRLVSHPSIRAVSFTGSQATGELLLGLINQRPVPIPFYGELSSINPLVVTEGASEARGPEIARGIFESVTGSGGQLCTKPGIAFIPSTSAGEEVLAHLSTLMSGSSAQVLLNHGIATSYREILGRLVAEGAGVVAQGSRAEGNETAVTPTLLATTVARLTEALAEECFGPLLVVARYHAVAEVIAAVDRLPGSLTASVHAEDDEIDCVADMFAAFSRGAGRLILNGYPTGVRVSWGQHHGGPWPATNSQHTSVGVTAIRRFLRPLAWQNAPDRVLPEELRESFSGIPRRIDGRMVIQ